MPCGKCEPMMVVVLVITNLQSCLYLFTEYTRSTDGLLLLSYLALARHARAGYVFYLQGSDWVSLSNAVEAR